MARPPKHDWNKLHLEYSQGNHKSVSEFAGMKGIYPDRMRKEFRRIESGAEQKQVKTSHNSESKQVKTESTPETFTGQCEKTAHKSGERCRHPVEPGEPFCRYHLDGRPGQCTGTSRQTKERCKKRVEPGKTKCKFHGGKNMGPPPGSQNALKHGFFAKIFPDDEETRALVGEIMEKSPLDIIWEQIIIQYTAIARAQKVMFVTHKREMIKELKKIKSELGERNPAFNPDNQDSKPFAETYREEEWEFQFAWDRQATFLKAQSMAMKTLEGLIQRYEAMASDEQKIKVQKLKHDMQMASDRLALEKAKLESGGEPGKGSTWADLIAGDDEDEES